MFLLYANISAARIARHSCQRRRRRRRRRRPQSASRARRTAFMCFVAAAKDIFHPQNRLKVHSAARWIPRKWAHRRLRYNVPNSSFRHLSFHVSPPNPFGILLIYPKTPLTLPARSGAAWASGNSVTQLSNVLRVTRRRTDRESLSRLQFPGWISAPLPPFRTLAPLNMEATDCH